MYKFNFLWRHGSAMVRLSYKRAGSESALEPMRVVYYIYVVPTGRVLFYGETYLFPLTRKKEEATYHLMKRVCWHTWIRNKHLSIKEPGILRRCSPSRDPPACWSAGRWSGGLAAVQHRSEPEVGKHSFHMQIHTGRLQQIRRKIIYNSALVAK